MSNKPNFLPYGQHAIDEDDIAAVIKILKSDHLTSGPATKLFESALVNQTGADFSICCSSGTAALYMALMAANIGPGDIVIVPSITFLATANVVRFVGAKVVFSDVDPNTGLMRPQDFLAALKLTEYKARAVIPVHFAGQCVDMRQISSIASKYSLTIIEDACHALGSEVQQSRRTDVVGNCAYSDMTVFSFHPVKTIAMGEGGAVMTNSPVLDKQLRLLRNHNMNRDSTTFTNKSMAFDANGNANPWFYEMHSPGYNYRASDIHCALGMSQLGKLDVVIAARRALVKRYDQALASHLPILKPINRAQDNNPAWHLYIVLIDFEKLNLDRASLMGQLKDQGVGSQVHYIPVHLQPYYQQECGVQHLPGAEQFYERCLSLPLFPTMTNQDVDRVTTSLTTALSGNILS